MYYKSQQLPRRKWKREGKKKNKPFKADLEVRHGEEVTWQGGDLQGESQETPNVGIAQSVTESIVRREREKGWEKYCFPEFLESVQTYKTPWSLLG